jgi:triacylglycerol lipase
MRVKIISIITCLLLLAIDGCSTLPQKSDANYCAATYPVVLVHGIGFRDKIIIGKYWGKTPEALTAHGAQVFEGGQDAYGVIADNAALLKNQILAVLAKTGAKKVNIIAHSRGGIESRFMISKLDMQDAVASLTTISTPHHGSSMADVVMEEIKDKNILPSVIDFFAAIFGDNNPASYNAGKELTRSFMKEFNRTVPDMTQVYYQSYAGEINDEIVNPMWKLMYETVKKYEGPNDGLVSLDSAKWGTFKGVMSCNGQAKVSHADEVGLHALSGMFCFDSDDFYLEVVHELKMKGY